MSALTLSLGMLREFASSAARAAPAPRLVQADGGRLPFPDATFDAVMLMQVFGARARAGGRSSTEARRVLRPAGALVLGHTVAPADGVDAQMKQRLASFLGEMGVEPDRHECARRGAALARVWPPQAPDP